jgi:hypothetical protein
VPAPALHNRIVGHRTVRAGDLKPHPLNWRTHSGEQRDALTAVLEEVGLARSVLAYVADADKAAHPDPLAPGTPLTLIDGHLRRDTLPDAAVTVEVLDVTDEEARKLLLTIDSLAALAGADDAVLEQLRETTVADSMALQTLWDDLAHADRNAAAAISDSAPAADPAPEQYLVIVTCEGEGHQADVLEICQQQGWKAKPLFG